MDGGGQDKWKHARSLGTSLHLPRVRSCDGRGLAIELSTNFREVSQCPENGEGPTMVERAY